MVTMVPHVHLGLKGLKRGMMCIKGRESYIFNLLDGCPEYKTSQIFQTPINIDALDSGGLLKMFPAFCV